MRARPWAAFRLRRFLGGAGCWWLAARLLLSGVPVADNTFMKVGLLGAAGITAWWFFLRKPAADTAVAPAEKPASGAAAYNSLDAIYARMVAAGGGDTGPDGWNARLVAAGGPSPAPDPLEVFPGVDRAVSMTAAQYWGPMSKYLAAHAGLSGVGIFGQLAGAVQ